MGLKEVQAVLAHIYTEPDFPLSSLTEPAMQAQWRLTPQEAQQLLALVGTNTQLFTHTLIQKRLQAVRQLLPHVAAQMGTDFDLAFCDFAADFHPDGIAQHPQDALAFATALRHDRQNQIMDNMLLFESTHLQARTQNRFFFQQYLFKGHPRLQTPGYYLALWIRPGQNHPLYHRLWRILPAYGVVRKNNLP